MLSGVCNVSAAWEKDLNDTGAIVASLKNGATNARRLSDSTVR